MIAEAVSNAVRHGQASTVDVTIQKTDEHLLVKVRDNGRGFEGKSFGPGDESFVASGTGPVSLRGRVAELGGSLDVHTSLIGTELHIQVPLI
jgi:signal transduction histidine kinase